MTSALSKKCLNQPAWRAVLRNEGGMATGTVMLIAVLMASMAIGILALNSQNSGRDTRYALFHSMLEIANINLYAFGQNDRAWRSTLDYNYSLTPKKFACIKEGYDCVVLSAPGVQFVEDIVLRYPTDAGVGTTYYDGSRIAGNARDGFRLDGSVCNFSQAATTTIDDGCILQIRLQWRPFCVTDCRIGPNKIMYEITYSTPKVDENGYAIGNRRFFLPAVPENQSGPMPIYNPFR